MMEGKTMKIIESLKARRSYYEIQKELPVPIETVTKMIEELTELVPDAFNMKSSRVIVVHGKKQDTLWDEIEKAFDGKVATEKINSFKSGAGTILYFYDRTVIETKQKQFPLYADNFPVWANHASAMLQLSIWSGLRELGIGASLQHYNPVIDDSVKTLLNLPKEYILIAQMPFGGIVSDPNKKEKEEIDKRVSVISE